MNLWGDFFGFLQAPTYNDCSRERIDVAIPSEEMDIICNYLSGQVDLLEQAKTVYCRYRWTHDILNDARIAKLDHRLFQQLGM